MIDNRPVTRNICVLDNIKNLFRYVLIDTLSDYHTFNTLRRNLANIDRNTGSNAAQLTIR